MILSYGLPLLVISLTELALNSARLVTDWGVYPIIHSVRRHAARRAQRRLYSADDSECATLRR